MSEQDPGSRGSADSSGSPSSSGERVEADAVDSDDDHLERLRELVTDLDETTAALVEHGAEHDLPAIEYNARRIRDTVRILEGNVPEARVVEDDPEDDSNKKR